MQFAVLAGVVAALAAPLQSRAQEKVLNLYSARHYQTDEALYSTSPSKPASRSTASKRAMNRYCSD